MKELTIEQKAKAYDKANYNNYKSFNELIERLESVKNAIKEHNYGIAMDILCNPYPEFQIITSAELQENEDEKIRKSLSAYFAKFKPNDMWDVDFSFGDVVYWLGKQGQVKESTISQHKNKTCKENDDSLTSEDEKIRKEIRDFICWATDRGCITKEQVEKSNSWLAWLDKQGETSTEDFGEFINILSKQFPEVSFAKLSRIAVRVKKWLEKQGEQKPNPVLDVEIPFGANDSELQEASYHIPEGFHAEIEGNKVIIKKGEQKPSWSERDETGLNDALWCCKQAGTIAKDENDMGTVWYAEDWLKSLKDRVQPQPKQEWSEEDIEMLNSAISFVEHSAFTTIGKGKNNVISWLKSLRDKVQNTTTLKR